MFFYKKHDEILAVSDESLIGKIFEEGDLIINVTEEFYRGEKCDSEKLIKLVENSAIVNAVGKKAVDLLAKEKLIDENKILKIKGIPHVQIIKI